MPLPPDQAPRVGHLVLSLHSCIMVPSEARRKELSRHEVVVVVVVVARRGCVEVEVVHRTSFGLYRTESGCTGMLPNRSGRRKRRLVPISQAEGRRPKWSWW